MAVTLSDDEVSANESSCDEDGNFISEENPPNRELSEDADLQEAYNKLYKVATKDAMNVELGLKKITSVELEKKNFAW